MTLKFILAPENSFANLACNMNGLMLLPCCTVLKSVTTMFALEETLGGMDFQMLGELSLQVKGAGTKLALMADNSAFSTVHSDLVMVQVRLFLEHLLANVT